MEKTRLTPIRFPVNLLDDLDKYVSEGNRSKFIIDATRKELHRAKQKKAIQRVFGILNQENYPEFKSSEDTASWVRRLREETEARRRDLFE